MKRIAISLPDHQAEAVEEIRRRRKIPRSRVIQEAVDLYFRDQARTRDVWAYVEGYRKHPERASDAVGYAKAAAEVLGPEDWD